MPRWGQTVCMTSRAGLPAEESDLIDVDELIAAYYDRIPDPKISSEHEQIVLDSYLRVRESTSAARG